MNKRNWRGLRPWRRHSYVLTVAGFVYLLIGLVYILVPFPPDRTTGISLALAWMPLPGWGVVWSLVGCLALASTRWPQFNETWGYTALTALSALWAFIYLLSIIFLGAPFLGLTAVLVWSLMGFLWWAISGLRNPDDVPKTILGDEPRSP